MPDLVPPTPPVTVPAPAAPPPVKPGYKTTEYWLTKLALVLTALYATGVIPTSGTAAQVAAIAASALGVLGYTVLRSSVKNTAAVAASSAPGFASLRMMLVLAMLAIGALALAPGCTHNDRTDTISATLLTVDAARDGLVAYDAKEQLALVGSAASRDDATTKLAAYRNARDAATGPAGLLATAYRGIAAAATANDATSLAAMQTAVAQFLAAVTPYLGAAK